jgi:hypothetical protein
MTLGGDTSAVGLFHVFCIPEVGSMRKGLTYAVSFMFFAPLSWH